MAGNAESGVGRLASHLRIPLWAVAALILLLLPLLAMQVTDEVVWDLADFVVAGALLFAPGLTYELVARKMGSIAYRAAVGIAVTTALLLVWVTGAVGIIGTLIARWQPRGMARALYATALAQASVAVIALIAGWGSTAPVWPRDILMATGFFVALWLTSASLFGKAAHAEPERVAV